MADLYYYQDDDSENRGVGYSETELANSSDDLLPHVQKLEKYAASENIFNRQIVARTILDTLRAVVNDPEDVQSVLKTMKKLADDIEPSVRAELMEQVPHIAMFCQEQKAQLIAVVPEHLLPMVVQFLTDPNSQVRKTSQAALLVLLEQGLVERPDVREQVCPIITCLTEPEANDDYKTEAVALLSKMAPLIGKEIVEAIFLDRFASLCVDPLFQVRKLCAANFGDFCGVVGSELMEKVLLPKFYYLCNDSVWGVRKACADVFMPVSCMCSPEVRQNELSKIFINLLRDKSRWVRMAAFQALGPFISTFADPSITALLHNEDGEIVINEPEILAERLSALEAKRSLEKEEKAKKAEESRGEDETKAVIMSSTTDVPESEGNNKMDLSEHSTDESLSVVLNSNPDDELSFEERRALWQFPNRQDALVTSKDEEVTRSNSFNSFLYWREPIVALEKEESVTKQEPNEEKVQTIQSHEEKLEELGQHKLSVVSDESVKKNEVGHQAWNNDESSWRKLPIITFQTFDDLTAASDDANINQVFREHDNASDEQHRSSSISTFDPNWDSQNSTFSYVNTSQNVEDNDSTSNEDPLSRDPALPKGPPATEQDIVPQLLIDHYVSMIDPSRAQTIDSEIARHCAFSLPAVALTLGRANWPLIKKTYEALATDMQWKVRRTLASSIHELAIILGEEQSGNDLIPVFNGFIKDLDEVRQGLLKHLADFLKLLSPQKRKSYLPKLSEFLKMDNDRNWRFRLELAEQLELLIPLYNPSEVEGHISPIAMVLVHDKVAAVRKAAIKVVASIVKALSESDEPDLADNILHCVIESLAREELWVHRQTFANFCSHVYQSGCVDTDVILPRLLEMAQDKVPNVRIAVARTLKFVSKDMDENHTLKGKVCETEEELRNDLDQDVRIIFNGNVRVFRDYQNLETAGRMLTDDQPETEDEESPASSNMLELSED